MKIYQPFFKACEQMRVPLKNSCVRTSLLLVLKRDRICGSKLNKRLRGKIDSEKTIYNKSGFI